MESDRQKAKGSIVSKKANDPDLDETLSSAENLQLQSKRAEYHHKEEMKSKDLGWLGSIFGGEKSAPTYIALLAMILGVFGAALCWYQASLIEDITVREFWATQSERAIAFSSAALAFIFGRGTK